MRLRSVLLSFVASSSLVLVVGCSSGGTGGGADNTGDGGTGGPGSSPSPANGAFQVTGVPLLPSASNGALAALDDGDVFFAGRMNTPDLVLARLGPAGEVRWAKSTPLAEQGDLPSYVVISGGHAWVISAPQAAPGLRIHDVDPKTGTINGAKSFTAGTFPVRGRALPDGGLILSSGDGSALRLDASLAVVWSKRARVGGDVTLLPDGGFALAGVGSSNMPINPQVTGGPAVGSGASLHLIDGNGASRGWYFSGPGPGTHTIGGVRTLPNGKILIALGVDSTRADAVVSLNPLALATFDPDGTPSKMVRIELRGRDMDDREVPLQFGGAYSMIARDDETWVGFAANSGAIGSDVRGSVVARFAHDGALRDVVFGGVIVAPTTGNAALMFNLVSGQLTLARAAPGDETCWKRPHAVNLEEVTPFIDSTSAADSALIDAPTEVSEVPVTPTDLTLTTSDGICTAR